MVLKQFQKTLEQDNIVAELRDGLIGEGIEFPTPFGLKKLVYADYTASGRALQQVEEFVTKQILPYYANSHTEASYCGAYMTNMREEARAYIADQVNAGDDCTVVFAGSGATAAVNRLVALCGIADLVKNNPNHKPTVFIGPYEHHSNILPWRESGAEVVEIAEAEQGGPDLVMLENELKMRADRALLVGSFSAASNVTGIVTDDEAVTKLLKRYGALAFWDYAGGGPYLPIDMGSDETTLKDAIFLSPHKFPGGPSASGLLIVRNLAMRATCPTWPGGGSVSYVSPWAHDYFTSIAEREEAGTPNIIGDIRVALVFMIKAAIGLDYIAKRDREFAAMAFAKWSDNPNIGILAANHSNRLPIFSFVIYDGEGGYIPHEMFTRLLSDVTGIQARGGCACAGPYGHRLLGVGRDQSEAIRKAISADESIAKPGWIRLNFSYLMDEETAEYIIEQVDALARKISEYMADHKAYDSKVRFEINSGLQCA
ncbi:MAG: aminotransferase class V-fold PLP-dependent enzyme [Alphaproteobacteria bacterium]|nr:aminotransferase class V-fold PLP-dependent enzyme [Alphaproteobacteria bacterium]